MVRVSYIRMAIKATARIDDDTCEHVLPLPTSFV
jgi:hypothetical protein